MGKTKRNTNKQKGKYLEDKLANMIEAYWELPDYAVSRAVSSGNFRNETGDIMFHLDESTKIKRPYIVFEAKRRSKLTAEDILYGSLVELNKWLDQINQAVEKFKQTYKTQAVLPVIVVGIGEPNKRIKMLAILRLIDFRDLLSRPQIFNLRADHTFFKESIRYVVNREKSYVVIPLEDFLSWIKPIPMDTQI